VQYIKSQAFSAQPIPIKVDVLFKSQWQKTDNKDGLCPFSLYSKQPEKVIYQCSTVTGFQMGGNRNTLNFFSLLWHTSLSRGHKK